LDQIKRIETYRVLEQTRPADFDCEAQANRVVAKLFEELPRIRTLLQADILAAYEGDPAAHSNMEIVMSYPGLLAIATHRIAHVFYREDVHLLPRVMSEYAHSRTGIDIHPGATIGKGFFIDHGTGVVIGETCEIGQNVRIYQGVTLGALSFRKDAEGHLVKGIKRHPNVEDDVIIYANATILGGDTTIGKGSVIGGNVWLTHSVPPGSRIFYEDKTV
jgi:serine O-acetyltransferase